MQHHHVLINLHFLLIANMDINMANLTIPMNGAVFKQQYTNFFSNDIPKTIY